MTSDEVYKLIEANGLTLHGDIEHFAALVASAERSACIKALEDLDAWNMDDPASTAAKAIREKYIYGTPLLDAMTKEKP